MSETTVRDALPKVSVLTLAAMVVGSMVGGGVFTLPQSFGSATGVLGALIAWTMNCVLPSPRAPITARSITALTSSGSVRVARPRSSPTGSVANSGARVEPFMAA